MVNFKTQQGHGLGRRMHYMKHPAASYAAAVNQTTGSQSPVLLKIRHLEKMPIRSHIGNHQHTGQEWKAQGGVCPVPSDIAETTDALEGSTTPKPTRRLRTLVIRQYFQTWCLNSTPLCKKTMLDLVSNPGKSSELVLHPELRYARSTPAQYSSRAKESRSQRAVDPFDSLSNCLLEDEVCSV